jgi:hypothetical protein
MGAVPAGNVEHILDRVGRVDAEGGFEKIEFETLHFISLTRSLDEEVHVVGKVRVIGAGGFLGIVFRASHNFPFDPTQDLRFLR